jgi:hypothetical protein
MIWQTVHVLDGRDLSRGGSNAAEVADIGGLERALISSCALDATRTHFVGAVAFQKVTCEPARFHDTDDLVSLDLLVLVLVTNLQGHIGEHIVVVKTSSDKR